MLLRLPMRAPGKQPRTLATTQWISPEQSTTAVITGLFYSGSPPHRAAHGGYDYLRQFDPWPHTLTPQAGPRSGPVADQLGSATVNFTHSHRSETMASLYHEHTKNLLVSYAPKKLGFF